MKAMKCDRAASISMCDKYDNMDTSIDLCDDCISELKLFLKMSQGDSLDLPAIFGNTIISKVGNVAVMNTCDSREKAQHVYDQLLEGRRK